VASAISGALPPICIVQLDAIANLGDLFDSWHLLAPPHLRATHVQAPGRPRVDSPEPPKVATPAPHAAAIPTPQQASTPRPASALCFSMTAAPIFQATPRHITFEDSSPPRVATDPPPRVAIVPMYSANSPPTALPVRIPIAHRTRSHAPIAPLALFTGAQQYHAHIQYQIPTVKSIQAPVKQLGFAGLCESFAMTPKEVDGFAYLCKALTKVDFPAALSVLDPATGKFLEHPQLRRDPRYKTTWGMSYANKLGRLCQGIGTGAKPGTKHVDGTNTFFRIKYNHIPAHNRKEICHTLVVCEVRPDKDDPDCTRITIGGSKICYPGDVGTNTALLELVKILLNSVLS
jgi:hypothetical protein